MLREASDFWAVLALSLFLSGVAVWLSIFHAMGVLW